MGFIFKFMIYILEDSKNRNKNRTLCVKLYEIEWPETHPRYPSKYRRYMKESVSACIWRILSSSFLNNKRGLVDVHF